MRKTITLITAALSVGLHLNAYAQEPALASMAWLSGCWAAESGEPGSEEHWLSPAGGTMLGIGRTVKKGKTMQHEFLQIRSNAEGKLVYIALPSGQKEASFVAISQSEGAITFENLQHDFPQRVSYRLMPGDKLAARIEGMRNGALRGIDFPMKRVPCDTAQEKPTAKP